MRLFLLLFALFGAAFASVAADANRLTYLDAPDPYYPNRELARFTTPQWVGEPEVAAVVIIAVDDLRETKKFEDYLRPVLERLKQIDGRAPASIMCNTFAPEDPQFQTWLKEGVTLEVHTLAHPCPLLGKAGFAGAAETYHGGVDLLATIPGNTSVGFRMPCCDSMNSVSPRFFAEIFPGRSEAGRFLSIDSSVMCVLTPKDKSLPRELVVEQDGSERFRKYFPMEMVPPRKRTFEQFAGYIEDYPYPYVIGRGCWEFPCMVPSDWEALNLHGPMNPRTTEDWKAALDAVVLKQGVMTMVLHPHRWSDPQQIIALIDHAVEKYGRRVKFLNFREALERLEKHALGGQSLRARDGSDNGIRLLDVNGDGFMDVVSGSPAAAVPRVWEPTSGTWRETPTPARFADGSNADPRVHFGVVRKDGAATMMISGGKPEAWSFIDGRWQSSPALLNGLEQLSTATVGTGVQLRDFDRDGICEIILSNPQENSIHSWSEEAQRWERSKFQLPAGVSLLNGKGEDHGLRFVDLNGDGFDDVLLSNKERYAIHLWTKNARPDLGWTPGWSQTVRAGARTGAAKEPPPIVRAGPHRNNGAWFRDEHLVVQNEDTAELEGVVDRRSFKELIAFDVPPAKSPEESLRAFQTRPGFRIELVAAEPLIVDPAAFDWDAQGRLWVVELRDYPLGMDGKGKAGGVVKLLTDTDGDGRYDKATTFLENLLCPTGLLPWRNGVLVCAAPDILYAEDTDGDGRADVRRVLFTGFKTGNEQHRINGLEWGIDGWIYGANGESGGVVKSLATGVEVNISGRDFRFRPDTGEFEAESGATQFGRRQDDWGNWFGNNNSVWLWHYTIAERYLRRNPKLAVKSTRQTLGNFPNASRVFPISEQPLRFNQPQSLNHVTSACSPTPYRDELFGADFATSVFISEPVHNLVHRQVLSEAGVSFTSKRAEDELDREFLASSDVWFRPSMLKTGPDGALYVADFYRFVLEHPEWIAPETQARLDLRAGEDKGRIYRVFPADQPLRKVPNLAGLSISELVAALDSSSGWQRDTVQRLLFERGDKAAIPLLQQLSAKAKNPRVRLQALAAIDLLGGTRAGIVTAALRDSEPRVRAGALRISEALAGKSTDLLPHLIALESDPSAVVRHQLAFTLGEWKTPEAAAAIGRLAERDGADPHMRTAILSSVPPENPLMQTLQQPASKTVAKAPAPPPLQASTPDRAKVIASYAGAAKLRGDANHGGAIFQQTCASCHRFKGEGRELGPDLGMVIGKPDEWLLTAIFDPNQAVEQRYQAQHVKMKAGADVLGLIVSETGNNITMRTLEGEERAILRGEIQELKPLGRSLMPEGLEAAMKPQDLADLLAFLRQP